MTSEQIQARAQQIAMLNEALVPAFIRSMLPEMTRDRHFYARCCYIQGRIDALEELAAQSSARSAAAEAV